MEKKWAIPLCLYVFLVVIAVIFLTIGIIFPDDFSMFGIPGVGVVYYVIILYLILYIVYLRKVMIKK